MSAPEHAAHFESLEKQASAARLGMWIFLASEVLLFAGFFVLYATLRARWPAGFAEGVHHADLLIGSVNTMVLLTASWAAADAVHVAREGRSAGAGRRLALAALLSVVFVVLKGVEYASHVAEGALPGGGTQFYSVHPAAGLPSYFTLYWIATSAHALHVVAGAGILGALAIACFRGRIARERAHVVELGALYFHLVDVLWIFLWPLFYLSRG
jgi:cytochrome c oxidase subunit 3